MKRAFLITGSILLIFALIVFGLWQKTNYTAKQQGKQTLSFREFLGLGAITSKEGTLEGYLSSGFTSNTGNTGAGTDSSSIGNDGKGTFSGMGGLAGAFGTSSFTPGSFGGSGVGGSGVGGSGNSSQNNNIGGANDLGNFDDTTTTTTDTNSDQTTTDTNVVPVSVECSDADMTLEFTPQESAKLADLTVQLQKLNGTLYSTEDLANQNENYNSLSLLLAKFTEENNYCMSMIDKLPTTGPLSKRVPTPYWHDTQYDSPSGGFLETINKPDLSAAFTRGGNWEGGFAGDPAAPGIKPDADSTAYYDLVESIFKLHIW